MSSPKASVIVCVYNRPRQVLECLESLVAMDFEGLEIVAVDDASTDDTPASLEEFRANHPDVDMVIVRNQQNLGVSGARNAGISVARGELVAFTDSDCTVDRGWLTALVEAFDAPEVAAVGGTVLDDPPRNLAERAYVGTCRVGRGSGQSRPLVGNNMCFRLDVLKRLRFDPALTYGCDEDELLWRLRALGYAERFTERAIVAHHHALDLRGYLGMARRQGIGSARFWYKSGSYLGRDLVFLYAAALTLPLGLLGPLWLLVPLGFLTLQAAALIFNEIVFKGKPLGEAVAVLPATSLANIVKGWTVAVTHARILLRRDTEIRRSKRRWRARLEEAAGGESR